MGSPQHAGVKDAIADGRIPVMLFSHEESGVPVTEPFEFWGLWVRNRALGSEFVCICCVQAYIVYIHTVRHTHTRCTSLLLRINGCCTPMPPCPCGAPIPTSCLRCVLCYMPSSIISLPTHFPTRKGCGRVSACATRGDAPAAHGA